MSARALTVGLVLVLVGGCSPATEPPEPTAPASGASSVAPPSGPRSTPGSTGLSVETPRTTVIDGLSVTTVSLGANTAPIDVIAAFGSIWVADHRADAVSRLDPVTLAEIARIQVGAGPGWFAVTEDALWVSNQLGRGLSRIDPATNTADPTARAGQWAPCHAPLVFEGDVWQMACDAGQLMRIDPAAGDVRDYAVHGSFGVAIAGDQVVVIGEGGLSVLDREADTLHPIGDGCCRLPDDSPSDSVWLSDGLELRRVSLEDGSTLATLPIAGELIVLPEGDRVWVSRLGMSVLELDLETNEMVRTLELDRPTVAREIDGALWVTSFDANTLSRVDLDPANQ